MTRHSGERIRSQLRVRVQEQNELAVPSRDAAVVPGAKTEVFRQRHEFDPREIGPHHRGRIIRARVVDHDGVRMLDFSAGPGHRFQTFAKESAGVEIHDDDVDAHGTPHSSGHCRAEGFRSSAGQFVQIA